jgi:hypothetical protein
MEWGVTMDRRMWWVVLGMVACDPYQEDPEDELPVDTEPVEDTDGAGESDLPGETDPVVDTDETEAPDETDLPLPSRDACVTAMPVVAIGTGETAYAPLTPGQVVEMVHGPQGGWHIWLGVSVEYAPQFVRLEYEVVDVLTGLSLSFDRAPKSLNIALVSPAPGAWTCQGYYAGVEARLDARGMDEVEPVPEISPDEPYVWQEVCGRTVRMTAKLYTPAAELLGSDSIEFVVQPDPADGGRCPPPS